jgi:hypothetical protein
MAVLTVFPYHKVGISPPFFVSQQAVHRETAFGAITPFFNVLTPIFSHRHGAQGRHLD